MTARNRCREGFLHSPSVNELVNIYNPRAFLCHPCVREDPESLFFVVVPAPAGVTVPRSRTFHFGGEDCLSEAPVLPVLSEAEGSGAEGSGAEGTLNQRPTTYKKQILHCVQNDNLRLFLGAPPGRHWFWVLLPKQKACPELALPVLSEAEGSEAEGSGAEGSGAEGNEVNRPREGTSSCGAETLHKKTKTLDPRSGSGMTEEEAGITGKGDQA